MPFQAGTACMSSLEHGADCLDEPSRDENSRCDGTVPS